jgi:drug/metabolite transporter (DMT)-like permease
MNSAAGWKRWLGLATLGVIWGSTWVASDTVAEQIPPLLASGVRFLVAAVVLVPLILLKRWGLPRGRTPGYLLLLSVSLIALPLVLLIWARAQLPSATVTVLFALMPIVVVLLTPVLEDRVVPNRATPAAIVGLGGMVLVTGASFSIAQIWGAAVVFVAVVFTGASSLIARRELKEVHPAVVAACMLGTAGLILLAASLGLERGQSAQWSGEVVRAVAVLGVLGTAVPYMLYFWLLQPVEAYQLATVQWIVPLVGLAETAASLRIGLSLSIMAGAVVTLGSALVVTRARLEDDNTVSLHGD